jgi:signal transduction histidine kinase
LPADFKNRSTKDIYWSFFWQLNAMMQIVVQVFLFAYYMLVWPEAKEVWFSFPTAISLTILGLYFFYRDQAVSARAIRCFYLSTFAAFLLASEISRSVVSLTVVWMIATHTFGSYNLRKRESTLWLLASIASYYYLSGFRPAWLPIEEFRTLRIENLINFSLVMIVISTQSIFYRMINEKYEQDLLESRQKIQTHFSETQTLGRILVHDISSPLSAVIGFLTIELRKTNASSPYIFKALSAAERMTEIINDARLMQKLRDGKTQIPIEKFDLTTAVEQSAQIFADKISAKGITLTKELKPVQALGHITLFSNQVVTNLLSNALKFTPSGGQIIVRTYQQSEKIIFEIEDSGIGIPDQLKSVLFDVRSATSRMGTGGEAGTGYGLPIVKEIVEKMNGTITVHNSNLPNSTGTCFRVTLASQIETPAIAS